MKALRNIIVAILLLAICAAVYIIVSSNEESGDTGDIGSITGTVVINEFMASNGGCLPDESGEYSDWIEIYNPSGEAVSLSGMGLSDENSGAPKWAFPGIMLDAGEYLVVFASGKSTPDSNAQYPHADFKLSASGGGIYLSDATGAVTDKYEYKGQSQDVSQGRIPGSDEWQLFDALSGIGPTPGFSNDEAGRTAFEQSRIANQTVLLITEVMPSNKTTLKDNIGEYSDYIEIYNNGSEAVNLAGYGLSDDAAKTLKWKFPEIAIAPGGYIVIYASGKGATADDAATGAVHTDFRISSYRETIMLANPQGLILDKVAVSEVPSDNAYQRIFAGGAYGGEWGTTNLPTPGYSNDEAGYSQFEQNNQVALGDIVINEVMTSNCSYLGEGENAQHQEYYDWIEIYNRGALAVNLAGYGLTDDSGNPAKWRFADVTLAPGQYLTVLASGLAGDDSKKKSISIPTIS